MPKVTKKTKPIVISKKKKEVPAKTSGKAKVSEKAKAKTIPALLNLAKDSISKGLKILKISTAHAKGEAMIPLKLKEGEKIDNGHKRKVDALKCTFTHDYEADYTPYLIWRWDEIKKDEKVVTAIWKRLRSVVRPLVAELRKVEREKLKAAKAKEKKSEKKVVAKKDAKKVVKKVTKKKVTKKGK